MKKIMSLVVVLAVCFTTNAHACKKLESKIGELEKKRVEILGQYQVAEANTAKLEKEYTATVGAINVLKDLNAEDIANTAKLEEAKKLAQINDAVPVPVAENVVPITEAPKDGELPPAHAHAADAADGGSGFAPATQ